MLEEVTDEEAIKAALDMFNDDTLVSEDFINDDSECESELEDLEDLEDTLKDPLEDEDYDDLSDDFVEDDLEFEDLF